MKLAVVVRRAKASIYFLIESLFEFRVGYDGGLHKSNNDITDTGKYRYENMDFILESCSLHKNSKEGLTYCKSIAWGIRHSHPVEYGIGKEWLRFTARCDRGPQGRIFLLVKNGPGSHFGEKVH